MGKFLCNLAQLTQPLLELMSNNQSWQWNPAQEDAFQRIKEELCKPTILSFYDPNFFLVDALCHGLRAVLLQLHNFQWKPVA